VSDTENTGDVAEEVQKSEDRLADAVEAVAYKKGHVKDDVKEAVTEKKEAVKQETAEKKHDLVGAVRDKIIGVKDALLSKLGHTRDAVTSRSPGGGEGQPQGETEGPQAAADTADELRGLAGDLRSEGRPASADLAEDEAGKIERSPQDDRTQE
jgi:hypothetical protein